MTWDGADGKSRIESVAARQKCHGDKASTVKFATIAYDGDGKFEGVQTEVQGPFDELSTCSRPTTRRRTRSPSTPQEGLSPT